jgi:hypothetical protein
MKILIISFVTLIILGFIGCGDGAEQFAETLPGIKNPGVVSNVSTFSGNHTIRITWDKLDDTSITGYNVYRSTTGEGYILVGSSAQSGPAYFQDEGDDADGDKFPDGLINNKTYFYKVTAFTADSRETPIDACSATSGIPGQLDNSLVDLAVEYVSAYSGKNQAFLSWPLIDDDRVVGYNIYRSVSGSTSGFRLAAIAPADINGYIDGGLSSKENYVYQVAPAVKELGNQQSGDVLSGVLEGRRAESRAIRPNDTDTSVPKPPGSSPQASYSVVAAEGPSGKGVTLKFTAPTANTDGTLISDTMDIGSGAYLIYRSNELYGQYDLVGIYENPGSSPEVTFTDDSGSQTDYYYIQIGDNFGNISDRSDIASALSNTPPPAVKSVRAESGASVGTIHISWSEIYNNDGSYSAQSYNVYRSEQPDNGFVGVAFSISDEDPEDDVVGFTDFSPSLQFNHTYYYKITAVADSLESSFSPPAAASPGPANGILVLEAENAVVRSAKTTGATDQFFANHWKWERKGYHSPFSGNGILQIEPQHAAFTDHQAGERIDLYWKVEIPGTAVHPTSGQATADVYMITADELSTGQYRVMIDDHAIHRGYLTNSTEISTIGGFNGMQAELNFRDSTYTHPIQPTRRLIGRLVFENLISDDPGNDLLDAETVYMTLVHTGPSNTSMGLGDLKMDALVLVFTSAM